MVPGSVSSISYVMEMILLYKFKYVEQETLLLF